MGTLAKVGLAIIAVAVLFAFFFGVCGGRLSKRSDALVRVPAADLHIRQAPAPQERI